MSLSLDAGNSHLPHQGIFKGREPQIRFILSQVLFIPHICHFFSTYPIFGSIFLHAKVRKLRQNGFRKNSVIRHKTDLTTTVNFGFLHICNVEICKIPPNLAKFHIFPASIVWKKLKFLLHMEKFQISSHLSCIEI